MSVAGFDEVSPVFADIDYDPIYVPVLGFMVLDSHMGANCDVGEGAGALVV